jgi:hypothetical protein
MMITFSTFMCSVSPFTPDSLLYFV